MIPEYLSPLANHLWQSTLVAGTAAVLAFIVRNNSARVRYWIWLIAALKFLIPFSLLVIVGQYFEWRTPPPIAQRPVASVVEISMPFVVTSASFVQYTPLPAAAKVNPLPYILLSVWLCGFAVCLSFWARSWWRVRAVLHAGSSAHVELPLSDVFVRAISCPALLEPAVFGIFRPVLLLPNGITDRTTPEQLNAILTHELCHVRRRDNLASAIYMLAETIFWFYPLVRWIGKQLMDERERACDEEVLRLGNEPLTYAEGILNVCKNYLESPLHCASGVTGSSLKKRVRAILAARIAYDLNFAKKVGLTVVAMGTLAIPIVVGMINAPLSHAQSQNLPAEFEVASVRPGSPGFTGAPGTPNGDGAAAFPACAGGFIQVDPQRFSATNTTLYTLITLAYGIRYSCFIVDASDLLSGGPKWVLSDRFDVQAVMPAGSPSYTQQQLRDGAAPALQAMLRNLLTERFKLAVHRSMKDMRVYVLTAVPGAVKLAPSRPEDRKVMGLNIEPDENKEFIVHVFGNRASVEDFTHAIEPVTHTPVLDRTGLTGEHSFDLKFAVIEPFSGPLASLVGATSPTIFTVLQQQLGLRLERTTAPVEAWVIDRAEKPSEN